MLTTLLADPTPKVLVPASLIEDLIRDFTAIQNRLTGVGGWKNLTASQRASVTAAANRAGIGKSRLQEF